MDGAKAPFERTQHVPRNDECVDLIVGEFERDYCGENIRWKLDSLNLCFKIKYMLPETNLGI